jgi:hypothetical protein
MLAAVPQNQHLRCMPRHAGDETRENMTGCVCPVLAEELGAVFDRQGVRGGGTASATGISGLPATLIHARLDEARVERCQLKNRLAAAVSFGGADTN